MAWPTEYSDISISYSLGGYYYPIVIPSHPTMVGVRSGIDQIAYPGKAKSDTGNPVREFYHQIPFPSLPYPPRPSPKFNELYWPTGASRYGSIWVMVTEHETKGIGGLPPIPDPKSGSTRASIGSLFGALKFCNRGQSSKYAQFCMARVRDIDDYSNSPECHGFELVDRRWLLCHAPWTYGGETTPSSLGDAINDQCSTYGIDSTALTTLLSTLSSSYSLDIDYDELDRPDVSLGDVIDAIALSVATVPFLKDSGSFDVDAKLEFYWPNKALNPITPSTYTHDSATGLQAAHRIQFQYRKLTHWHRDKTAPKSVVCDASVSTGTAEPTANIPCSAFWIDGDSTNNATLNTFADFWEYDWCRRLVDGRPITEPIGRWGSLTQSTDAGSATDYSTCDHVLISLDPGDVRTTQTLFNQDFLPTSIIVRDDRILTWENLIVKTPGGGIPARLSSAVSPTRCDIYYLDGTTLTSQGETVYVYTLEDAIPGNTYVIAVLMNDGTYCAQIGGSGSSSFTIRHGSALTTCLPGPGTSFTVDEESWNGTAWVSLGNSAVTVYDSGGRNCYLPGEHVVFIDSAATSQPECLGSFGLERFAKAIQEVVPDKSYPSRGVWNLDYSFDLMDFDESAATSPSLGNGGAFIKLDDASILVRDPLRTSCVWRNQIVPVSYSPEMRVWTIRYPVGIIQRGRIVDRGPSYTTGPGDPGLIEVELYDPFISVANDPQNYWTTTSNVRVYVKREFCRVYPRDGDEVEIRRDPVARSFVTVPGNSVQFHSAWVVSSNVSNHIYDCVMVETAQSTPANRTYNISLDGDGRQAWGVGLANWSPRPEDVYKRMPNVDYNAGTRAAVMVRPTKLFDGTGQQFCVISTNETPVSDCD